MKFKRSVIIPFIIACSISSVVLFLVHMPAYYIWIHDAGNGLNQTHLVKLCPNGVRTAQVLFGQSGAIGIDPRNGSIWIPELNDADDVNFDQVVHVDDNGQIIHRYNGYRTLVLAVDPNDGSVWIGLPSEAKQLVKLSSEGKILVRVPGSAGPASIAVNSQDSSIWIADFNVRELVHRTAQGVVLFTLSANSFHSDSPHQIAIDPRNSDIWHVNAGDNELYKRSPTGDLLAQVDGFDIPVSISTDPRSGNIWVADFSINNTGALVKLDSNGNKILRIILEKPPYIAVYNPNDNTVWVGIDKAMIKLNDEGKILKTVEGFTRPYSIAIRTIDNNILEKFYFVRTCGLYL